MPRIGVNLGDVQAYEALPNGTYDAEIAKITLKPAQEEGKFDQQMVQYTVIEDGPQLGASATEWLSFSPKAAFRMKKWYDKFGYGDLDDLDFNDDTDELDDPDLVGTRVVIKSFEEADNRPGHKDEVRNRISLVEVLDDVDEPAPKKASKAEAVAVESDDDDDEDDEPEEKPRARRVAREPAKAAPGKTRRSLR